MRNTQLQNRRRARVLRRAPGKIRANYENHRPLEKLSARFRTRMNFTRLLFPILALLAATGNFRGAGLKEARVTAVVKDVKLLPGQAEPKPAAVNDTVKSDTAVRTGVDSRSELTF